MRKTDTECGIVYRKCEIGGTRNADFRYMPLKMFLSDSLNGCRFFSDRHWALRYKNPMIRRNHNIRRLASKIPNSDLFTKHVEWNRYAECGTPNEDVRLALFARILAKL